MTGPSAVFLDDTPLRAYMNPADPLHIRARSYFHEIIDLERPLVTSNLIVYDTHQWLRDKCGFDHAQFFLDAIEQAVNRDMLTVLSPNADFEQEAKRLLTECPKFRFSFSEAMTTVMMLRNGIRRLFTFNPTFSMLPMLHEEIKVIPQA